MKNASEMCVLQRERKWTHTVLKNTIKSLAWMIEGEMRIQASSPLNEQMDWVTMAHH